MCMHVEFMSVFVFADAINIINTSQRNVVIDLEEKNFRSEFGIILQKLMYGGR